MKEKDILYHVISLHLVRYDIDLFIAPEDVVSPLRMFMLYMDTWSAVTMKTLPLFVVVVFLTLTPEPIACMLRFVLSTVISGSSYVPGSIRIASPRPASDWDMA